MAGVVYLVCDPSNDLYKIGMTRTNHSKRLKQLQTGNGTELIWLAGYECEYPNRLESMLHNRFKAKNTVGEWFALDFNEVQSFIEICDELNNTIKIMKNNPFFSKNLK